MLSAVLLAVTMGDLLAACHSAPAVAPTQVRETVRSEGARGGALSPSTAGTGGVNRPEGHQGPWYDSEPKDPWEHFVWRSQSYVGNRISLGLLTSSDTEPEFVGEPNYCDKAAIDRLAELQLEHRPGTESKVFPGCSYWTNFDERTYFGDGILISIIPGDVVNDFEKVELDLGGKSELLRVITGDKSGTGCGVAFLSATRRNTITLETVPLNTRSNFGESCRRSYLAYWALKNISIL